MRWNRKGLLICSILFLGLIGFLTGKALFSETDKKTISSYASEEDVVFPSTGSGTAVEKIRENVSPMPKVKNTQKKQTKQPTMTATATAVATQKKTTEKKTRERTKAVKTKKKDRKSKATAKSTAKPTISPAATATAAPAITQEKEMISFEIQCVAIMGHKELWKEGIEEIIPTSGYFYQGQQEISEGTTVYDVLKRICKEKNIALDTEFTPLYGTYYIKGIGNLYEFDCGSESGWKYKVNETLPGVGCSDYSLKKGDRVSFFYDYQY